MRGGTQEERTRAKEPGSEIKNGRRSRGGGSRHPRGSPAVVMAIEPLSPGGPANQSRAAKKAKDLEGRARRGAARSPDSPRSRLFSPRETSPPPPVEGSRARVCNQWPKDKDRLTVPSQRTSRVADVARAYFPSCLGTRSLKASCFFPAYSRFSVIKTLFDAVGGNARVASA